MVSSKNVIALFWVQNGMWGRGGEEHDFHALLLPQIPTASTRAGKTIKSSSFISMPERFFPLASRQNSLIIIVFGAGSGRSLKLCKCSREALWSWRLCQAGQVTVHLTTAVSFHSHRGKYAGNAEARWGSNRSGNSHITKHVCNPSLAHFMKPKLTFYS